jgi:hypothetical protein
LEEASFIFLFVAIVRFELISQSRVLEKLIVAHPVNTLPDLYGTLNSMSIRAGKKFSEVMNV